MSVAAIQGFEYMVTTATYAAKLLASDFVQYLGLSTPKNTTNWFAYDGIAAQNGPLIVNDDYYIEGQSLKICRPNDGTLNGSYNGTESLDITVPIASSGRSIIGFATKFDKLPNVPICLARFGYDDGVNAGEQASLWVSPSGALYFSGTAFDFANTGVITPTPITATLTAPGAARLDHWTYYEVMLDLNSTTPICIISVNGNTIVDSVADAGLSKITTKQINSVSIVNPHNGYFTGGFTQWVDDIYVLRSITGKNLPLGPQQVKFVQPNGAGDTTQWTPDSGVNYTRVNSPFNPASLAAYVSQTASGQLDKYLLADLVSGISTVNAVCMRVMAGLVSAGTGTLTMRMYNSTGSYIAMNQALTSTTAAVFSFLSEVAPDSTTLTPAKVNDTIAGLYGV